MEASTGVTYIAYEVPKETLYSLSKTFGMSQEGFIALNPQLNGVEIGMVLKVPLKLLPKRGQERVYSFVKKKSVL
jgi:hypothetical protein